MKITLRKANALQKLIMEQLKKPLSATATIDKYCDAATTIHDASQNLAHGATARTALLSVLFNIRDEVGVANHEEGVNERLTKIAYLNKLEEVYKQIASATSVYPGDERVLKQQTDLVENAKLSQYAGTSFSVSILTPEIIKGSAQVVNDARKERQKLIDELLEINIQAEIELSDDDVAVLTELDIL